MAADSSPSDRRRDAERAAFAGLTVPDHPHPIPHIFEWGTVSLLSGPSGVGKSTLLADWLVRLRDEKPICGLATHQPASCGVIAADRGWASHRQWFARAGWADVPSYSLVDDTTFDPALLLPVGGKAAPAAEMRRLLAVFASHLDRLRLPPYSVVLVDPLAVYLAGNLGEYKTTAVALVQLTRLAIERKLCIIGTAHHSKQKVDQGERYNRPQDRILGSTALLGFTCTQLYLIGPEDTGKDYYEVGLISHHLPARAFQLIRDPTTALFTPFKSAEDDKERSVVFELFPLVTDPTVLEVGNTAGGIVTRGMLMQEAAARGVRISDSTLNRHLIKLVEQGLIEKVRHGCYRRAPVLPVM